MKKMRKLIAVGVVLAVAIALVLSFALPVAATTTGTGTGVTVQAGTSDPPLIKAKWEQLAGAVLEDGDPTHIMYPGSTELGGRASECRAQFLPSGQYEVNKTVQYWVVVMDPNGADDIAEVYVRVFHPNAGAACEPADGSEKYELRLTEKDKGLIYDLEGNVTGYEPNKAVDKFLKAWAAHLVTFDTTVVLDPENPSPEELAELMLEIDKCDARFYMATGPLDYHQPCGHYTVKAKAVDKQGVWATPLLNCFYYFCLQAFRIDFDSVDFGNVNISSTKWIWGDINFDTPVDTAPSPNPATVHNIGNMPMKLKIAQSDMDMGFTGLASTQLSSSTEPPVENQTTWNVYFDARLGSNVADEMYFDPYDPDTQDPFFVELPTVLMPCTPQELDLSIHVKKADPDTLYIGLMTLECVEADWICGTTPGKDPYPVPPPTP